MKKSLILAAALLAVLAGFRAAAEQGYLLNMYHFNLQYVAGSDKAERAGVEKGLEPLLDIYLAHLGWKADFEMQSEFITYLAKNYPEVLEKLRTLAKNGQAEMVSFHYADQLILGFPALDEERSLQLTREIFEQYDIPLSGVIFTQEAQFGEGVCRLGKKWGYQVAVMTPGSYNWFQDDPGYPYFSCRGFEVLKAEDPDIKPEKTVEYSGSGSGVRAKWYFLGDGELVVTGGISPYFAGFFRPSGARIKKIEADFKRYQSEGYQIATVGEYLEALRRNKVQPRPLKPMLDAPWRPTDDSGVFTWMGKQTLPKEQDWAIRTENWQARAWLLAAEKAGLGWEQLREVWKDQLDAEVSDSTGWFPFEVELKYSPAKSQAVIAAVKKLCPECRPEEIKFEMTPVAPGEFPVAARVTGAKKQETKFFKVKGRNNLYAVETKITTGKDTDLSFPWTGPEIVYSPAMIEMEVVHIPLDQIKHSDFYVGLANGLAALDRDLWIIRDNRAGMVACGFDMVNKKIHFRLKGGPGREIFYRVFVFKGPEKEALAFANQLNQTQY